MARLRPWKGCEDGDREEVVKPSAAGRRHPRDPGGVRRLLPGGLRREVAHRIGDEHPGADQPDADAGDQGGDGPGTDASPGKAKEIPGGAGVENPGKDEVGALQPSLTADRERADRVVPPVVAASGGSNGGERADEEGAGEGAAPHGRGSFQRRSCGCGEPQEWRPHLGFSGLASDPDGWMLAALRGPGSCALVLMPRGARRSGPVTIDDWHSMDVSPPRAAIPARRAAGLRGSSPARPG